MVLESVLDAGLVWLAVLGVFFAVIGAFYYLRVIWFMYFSEAEESAEGEIGTEALEAPTGLRIAVSMNALLLLAFGLFPGALLDLCGSVLGLA